MREQLAVLISALVGALAMFLMRWAQGRYPPVSGKARGPVAPVSEPTPARLADVLEAVQLLEADMKGMKRQWGDFEQSWETRWGRVARQGRRERAAAAAEPEEGEGTLDPAQMPLTFPEPSSAPRGAVPRRLVAASRMRG